MAVNSDSDSDSDCELLEQLSTPAPAPPPPVKKKSVFDTTGLDDEFLEMEEMDESDDESPPDFKIY